MAEDPPSSFTKNSSGDEHFLKPKRTPINKSPCSDDELLPSRFSKRHQYETKFFNRDEQCYVHEESSQNTTGFSYGTTDFNGFGNNDEYNLKRFPKPPTFQPKFFIREENVVYEGKQDESCINETEYQFNNNRKGKNRYEDGSDIYREPKHEEVLHQFRPQDYYLFNNQKEASSSDEDDSELLEDDDDVNDLHGGSDADDEGDCSELDENDFEGIDIKENPNINEPPFFQDISIEENKHLFAQLTKRTHRVFRKIMRPNPLNVGKEKQPKEDIWKGTPYEKDDGLKMPPEPPNEYWYPKPGDPEYLGPLPVSPGGKFEPWFKTIPDFMSEHESSETPGSLRSDYITESSKNYSTETYIDSDELSTCPEDEPIYPVIPKEFFEEPKKFDFPNEFQRIPEGNPEVEIWFDCKAREFLDVKNEKGEWVTVEQIVPEYPPKPKHPDRWEMREEPKKKPDNCTCDEFDLTGWYDDNVKFKTPERNLKDDPDMLDEKEGHPIDFNNENNAYGNSESPNNIDKEVSEFKTNSTLSRKEANPSGNNTRHQDENKSLLEERQITCENIDVDLPKTNNISKDNIKLTPDVISNIDPVRGASTSDSEGSSGDENNPGGIETDSNNMNNGMNKNKYTNRDIQKTNENKENIFDIHKYKTSSSTKFTGHGVTKNRIFVESRPIEASYVFKVTKKRKPRRISGNINIDLMYPYKLTLMPQKKGNPISRNRTGKKTKVTAFSLPKYNKRNVISSPFSLENSLGFIQMMMSLQCQQLTHKNYKSSFQEQQQYYRLSEDLKNKLQHSNKLSLTNI